MRVERVSEVIVRLPENEAQATGMALYEALSVLGLPGPDPDGYPHNWRSDPSLLRKLYNLLKHPEWLALDE